MLQVDKSFVCSSSEVAIISSLLLNYRIQSRSKDDFYFKDLEKGLKKRHVQKMLSSAFEYCFILLPQDGGIYGGYLKKPFCIYLTNW